MKDNNYKFDSKTLDPYTNKDDLRIIESARRFGWVRHLQLARIERGEIKDLPPFKYDSCVSSSLREVIIFHQFKLTKSMSYLDIGCGISPDTKIAKLMGCGKTYKIDLYEPHVWQSSETDRLENIKKYHKDFIKVDCRKRLPFKSNSLDIITCQAMIDFVPPKDRPKLYKECFRILKPKGVMAILCQPLKHGHGVKQCDEKITLIRSGFNPCGGNILFIKP